MEGNTGKPHQRSTKSSTTSRHVWRTVRVRRSAPRRRSSLLGTIPGKACAPKLAVVSSARFRRRLAASTQPPALSNELTRQGRTPLMTPLLPLGLRRQPTHGCGRRSTLPLCWSVSGHSAPARKLKHIARFPKHYFFHSPFHHIHTLTISIFQDPLTSW